MHTYRRVRVYKKAAVIRTHVYVDHGMDRIAKPRVPAIGANLRDTSQVARLADSGWAIRQIGNGEYVDCVVVERVSAPQPVRFVSDRLLHREIIMVVLVKKFVRSGEAPFASRRTFFLCGPVMKWPRRMAAHERGPFEI